MRIYSVDQSRVQRVVTMFMKPLNKSVTFWRVRPLL